MTETSLLTSQSFRVGGPAGSARQTPLQFRDDPLLWAGWLYAQDGLTQNEIAKAMGVSRATVNGYLAEARSRGIVTLTMETSRLSEFMIAQALKERFALTDCIVIPATEDDGSLTLRLGRTGAHVLERLTRPGDTIGVSWGRTMIALARSVSHMKMADLSVIQMTGGSTSPVDFTPELCVSQMATALGARSVNITAPAVVSSPSVRDMLMAEPVLRDQFAMARRANKVVFGICSTRPGSTLFESGLILADDVCDAALQRATAVIAGRFIDDRGRALGGPLDARTIGLTLDEIRKVKLRIAVAGGAEKVPAILAALRGGYANVLITDAATAHRILQAEGMPASLRALRGTRRTQVQGGTTMKTKKLINDPKDIIEEMLEGMMKAHPGQLQQLLESPRSIVAAAPVRAGKVAIIVGGGSGHEPSFVGFVGRGLADGCAIGNVFASPPPDPIVACTKAVDTGGGVLYLYGNYAGDVMNFDMAAELAGLDGVEVRTVVTTDDVASAPLDRRSERRGVAGNFFVFKVAGAAADKMWPLDECVRIANKANDSTFTVGVALSPCSLPQTRRHNFEIGEGEMEIGMGIHGEPGVAREPLATADAVTDDMLERIFAECPAKRGSKVAVLINSLGSTPLMELYVVNRRVHERLEQKGVKVHANWVGTYCSSLEMAGMSITLIALDDELIELLDHPCDTPALRVGQTTRDIGQSATARADITRHRSGDRGVADDALADDAPDGALGAVEFGDMIRAVRKAIDANVDRLSELDGIVGDGDHGVTMAMGWAAAERAVNESVDDATITTICRQIGKAFLEAVGASSGPLLASAFLKAGESAKGRKGLDAKATAAFVEAAYRGIAERGKAQVGDRTMVDAWAPASERAAAAADAGEPVTAVLKAAAAGAKEGMEKTADIVARKGRSAKLGERALGHVDPGAASTVIMLEAMARVAVDER